MTVGMIVGGQSRISLLVLNDPETVRMNGARATAVKIAAIVRKSTREIRNLKRGCCTATVCARASVAISDLRLRLRLSGLASLRPSVIRPDVEHAPLDERDDEDTREEDHAHGARVAHVQVTESLPPDQVRDRERGLVRAAVRRDLDLVVELEAADGTEQHDEEDRGAHERKGDLEELADRTRPVEVGRLVDRAGHVLDRGEEDQHHRRGGRPDVHEHDRRQRRRLVAQPVDSDADADEVEGRVDESVREEEPHEDERRDDARRDTWQVPRDPEEAPERDLPIEDRGHHQTDERLRRDHDRRVGRDIADRVQEALILEGLLVVIEADENGIREQVVVREGEVEGDDDRPRDEDQQEDEPWRDEEVRGQPLAPVTETRGAANRPSRNYRHALRGQKRLDRCRELVERVLDVRFLEHDRLERLRYLVVHLARVRAGVVERLAIWGAVEDRL